MTYETLIDSQHNILYRETRHKYTDITEVQHMDSDTGEFWRVSFERYKESRNLYINDNDKIHSFYDLDEDKGAFWHPIPGGYAVSWCVGQDFPILCPPSGEEVLALQV